MHLRKIVIALGLWAAAGMSPAQQTPSPSQLATMDLEAALMAVQSNRAALLDLQVQDAIRSVKARQDYAQKLDTALDAATALRATLPASAPAGTPTPGGSQKMALELASRNAGQNLPFATVGQLDATMQQLRVHIAANANTLQMEMLRLQSLANKHTEGLPLVTNEAKKLQSNRVGTAPMR
jgi:hypothetical protein